MTDMNVREWMKLLSQWLRQQGLSAFFYQQLPDYLRNRKLFSRARARGYIVAIGSYSGRIKLWKINETLK